MESKRQCTLLLWILAVCMSIQSAAVMYTTDLVTHHHHFSRVQLLVISCDVVWCSALGFGCLMAVWAALQFGNARCPLLACKMSWVLILFSRVVYLVVTNWFHLDYNYRPSSDLFQTNISTTIACYIAFVSLWSLRECDTFQTAPVVVGTALIPVSDLEQPLLIAGTTSTTVASAPSPPPYPQPLRYV